ncbi:MAG: hypothetical protein K0R46_579, partial [Herbinix sp.]|nr:hypothetical protein [Herbinix sp.]
RTYNLSNARNALEQAVRGCEGQVRNIMAVSIDIIYCSEYVLTGKRNCEKDNDHILI